MRILYDSLTGNTKRFAESLPFPVTPITEAKGITEPYILLTYTTGFGEVPPTTTAFLDQHFPFLVGVAVSGNKNWGAFFGKAGDTIAQTYGVPLLMKFELGGSATDRNTFIQELQRYTTKQNPMELTN